MYRRPTSISDSIEVNNWTGLAVSGNQNRLLVESPDRFPNDTGDRSPAMILKQRSRPRNLSPHPTQPR